MAKFNIFGGYSKPGRGVSKSEVYEKSPFAKYFEILGRKFWDICILSLIFLLTMVPFIGLSYLIYTLIRNTAIAGDLQLSAVIILSPFMLSGPFFGGASRIARDFAREEPVFIWNDFFSTVKKNIKQPLALSIIGYICFVALSYALPTYYAMSGAFRYVCLPLCMLAALVYLFMQYYVYTMAVSFNLKLFEIIKNGIIFSFAVLLRNFLITLVLALITVITFAFLYIGLSVSFFIGIFIILSVCFVTGLLFYSVNFITYPALKRYIIDPYYENNKDQTAEGLSTPEEDDGEAEKKPLPEYVYHNGRMVHRSVLEAETVFDDDIKGNGGQKNDDN